jgi:hypothetical protein
MAPEIDILLDAVDRGLLVVEKDSNVMWSGEDLRAAQAARSFDQEDCLAPATVAVSVSGPYPGCPQQGGASADYSRHSLCGQTAHFLLFAPQA